MVLRFEAFSCEIANLANLLDHHVIVFAAFRSFRLNHVRELPHGGGVLFGCGVRCGLVFGNLLGEFLGFGNQLGLFVGRSRGDLLADFFLLRTCSLKFLQKMCIRDRVYGIKYQVGRMEAMAPIGSFPTFSAMSALETASSRP